MHHLFDETLMRHDQKTKQAKLKERRKKFKEKKAAAMAMANAKKTAGKESIVRHPSDMDEATHASKRLKVTSSDLPGGAKDVHRTSLRGEARKILVKEGRRNRKETIKSPVPRKSKKRLQMDDEGTPAH